MNKTMAATALILALTILPPTVAADTTDTNVNFIIKTVTSIELYLNSTRSNKTYINNTYANMTAMLNVKGNVYIYTNITGWGGPDTGPTPLTNITLLTSAANETYNITAVFPANATHYGDIETWFITLHMGNIAPSIPTLWAPSNNSNTDSTVIVMLWNESTDLNGDIVYYWLELSNDSIFATTSLTNYNITEHYTPADNLADDIYYWRVLAGDQTTNSTWSKPYIFNKTAWGGGGGTTTNITCNPCISALGCNSYSPRRR